RPLIGLRTSVSLRSIGTSKTSASSKRWFTTCMLKSLERTGRKIRRSSLS
ncbi:uncharacterized protein METZ01_LOCUS263469, partial [marine metagenome]